MEDKNKNWLAFYVASSHSIQKQHKNVQRRSIESPIQKQKKKKIKRKKNTLTLY